MKLTEVKFLNPVTIKGALFHYVHAEKRRFVISFQPEFSVISILDDKGDTTLTPFTNVIWCKAVIPSEEPKKK